MEYGPEEDPHFLSSSIHHIFSLESPVPQKKQMELPYIVSKPDALYMY